MREPSFASGPKPAEPVGDAKETRPWKAGFVVCGSQLSAILIFSTASRPGEITRRSSDQVADTGPTADVADCCRDFRMARVVPDIEPRGAGRHR